MLAVTGLQKRYGKVLAVDDLSFSVDSGQILGLVGPNGAGKTTTLRCSTGIIPPTAGTIHIGNADLRADPVAAKRQYAFFPDEPRLFDYLTVRQHLAFIAKVYGVKDHAARAETLLARLELADKAKDLPGNLSRGMKQKLVIACGLMHQPQLLIFDEPLTGLDPLAIRRMKDLMLELARDGAAIVLSSHLLHLLDEVCSHVLFLKQGRKLAHGTLAEVKTMFSNGESDVPLEEIFIRATGGAEA